MTFSPQAILDLRKRRQLHTETENRLRHLFRLAQLNGVSIPEGWGLSGNHRTDFVVYLRDRRIIHFELFGHKSTVPRDLNMLLTSPADIHVALIVDPDADISVSEAYFRSVPDNRFRWHWVSEFLDPANESRAVEVINELLTEAENLGGPLVSPDPTLTISPTSGAPYSRVDVRVEGFNPTSDFSVMWDHEDVTVLLAGERELSADGSGATEILVPHGGTAVAGKHSIRAIDSLGNVARSEFYVTPAWPFPTVRVLPTSARPDDSVTLVGGGAPPLTELSVFYWIGHSGWSFATLTSDERGEFAGAIVIPWMFGQLQLIQPGRCKLQLIPKEGGAQFRAHTYIDILPFNPPGILQWQENGFQTVFGLTFINPSFQVEEDLFSVSLRVRNDRNAEIALFPCQLAIQWFDHPFSEQGPKRNAVDFELVESPICTIEPGAAVDAVFRFRVDIDLCKPTTTEPFRTVIFNLPIINSNREVETISDAWRFPFGLWGSSLE